MTVKAIIDALFGIIGNLIAPALAYFKGRTDAENENLKDINERLSNRPRTSTDRINRLRAWRDKLKRKGE